MVGHVHDGVLALVGIPLLLRLDGGVRDGGDGDAGALGEHGPDRPRQVEEQALGAQHQA